MNSDEMIERLSIGTLNFDFPSISKKRFISSVVWLRIEDCFESKRHSMKMENT